jgi:hypothetical protein
MSSRCATAALLLAGAVGIGGVWSSARSPVEEPAVAPHHDALAGLWTRFEGKSLGDPLRFWYFHGDGHGLLRYGRVGSAATRSFDYVVGDGHLELTFRKTGERQVLAFTVEQEGGERWLVLEDEPREPGARYRWRRGPLGGHEDARGQGGPGDRVWIDWRNFASGGGGFSMYQLGPAAIDGRGLGWFHRGDFDDWTTESLRYRVDGDALELEFELRGESARTTFSIAGDGTERSIELAEDPRDFGAPHRYRDGGRSFSGHAWHGVTAAADPDR